MARRKQQPLYKPKTPLESLGLLILALPLIIWNLIKKYPVQSFLVISAVVALVVLLIWRKRKQRIAYLKAFYNRESRLRFLNNNDFIDVELTNKILLAAKNGNAVPIGGEPDRLFKELTVAYERLKGSKDEAYGSLDRISFTSDNGRSLIPQNGIKALCSPLGLNFSGEERGSYSFYIFPETVLAFFDGPEKSVFLAAFDPEALEVYCQDTTITTSVVVREKSQEHIRYYDKFCPYSDAEIIESFWKVTNKDGSRSFKGGLLPENNPLTFKMKYQAVYMRIGDYKVATAFSNNRAAQLFEQAYDSYKWENQPTIPLDPREEYEYLAEENEDDPDEEGIMIDTPVVKIRGINEGESEKYDDAFTRTDATIESEQRSVSSGGDLHTETPVSPDDSTAEPAEIVSETKSDAEAPQSSAGESNQTEEKDEAVNDETETIRVRNREIAKRTVNDLDKLYPGKYDFKTYQVRKQRSGWNLQDAGVYTYLKDNEGNQYTIEFDLKTDLNTHTSAIRFSIWGKTKELVANKYKITVSKGKMKENGEGYSLWIKRDYENMIESDMSDSFSKDCQTLMKLVSYDDPR